MQANALAMQLRNTRFIAIYSSPLKRALITAEVLQKYQESHVPLHTSPLLQEQHFGRGEGQRYDVRRQPGLSFDEHIARGTYIPPQGRGARFPDGESLNDVAERADQAVQHLIVPTIQKAAKEATDKIHVAIVSHGMFLTELIASLVALSGTKADPVKFRGLRNTGWSRLTVQVGKHREGSYRGASLPYVKVVHHNRSDHLDHLVRQKGGIGSATYDPNQKDIHTYFTPKAVLVHSLPP